nr:MAG TPA: Siderophore-interacting FAD-binding domain [Caudoviricetes sp.]
MTKAIPILSNWDRLYLILHTCRILPFPSYEVGQYVLVLVLLVVERSYSIAIGFAADCPLLHT